MAGGPSHPYFPQDAVIPGYTPNTMSIPVILGAFNAFAGTSVVGSVALAKWSNPSLKRADLFVVGWFALCEYLRPLRFTSYSTNRSTTRRIPAYLFRRSHPSHLPLPIHPLLTPT